MTKLTGGNSFNVMAGKIDWIINKNGESPYDMMRRGISIPASIVKEADDKRRSQKIPLNYDPSYEGLQPLFPGTRIRRLNDGWL